ncbi:MAG: GNAT family N-acetyltransferase [Gammaproteobacteria bacterium]
MNDSTVHVRVVSWDQARPGASAVREQVFVHEQHVPPELEWDGLDPRCVHVVARVGSGEVVGTARMLADGHIGRMAVLPAWRGRGVGSALLRALLEEARRRGIEHPFLHAQTTAVGFYLRHGFAIAGNEFIDAGIPHVAMVRDPGPGQAPGS